ncbi:hypothetical protein [Brachybacterium sp. EE-P12]|uniref:hypothetical protein n=1 Tax=Brachybacterium sp. EE-P12 TaxID=2306299 RepID=UPI000F078434|nr:hypothetical protein [Brachybacterium sp. EE-P12]
MAVSFYGADTAQLMDMGQRMRVSMMTLQDIQRQIVQSVATVEWTGPDAETFRGDASSRVTAPISTAIEDLGRRAEELGEHAREQDDASDPRGTWEKINDFLHVPAQVTRFARNLQKLIQDPKKMMDMFRRFPELRQTFKDLKNLDEVFPALSALERRTIRAEWADELLGRGWEKLGNAIPQKISSLLGVNIPGKEWAGKMLSHMDEITDATKPWVKLGSKTFGKVLPGLDIGLGVRQMMDPDSTGYDKFSGGLSTVGGVLTLAAPLAGPAAPIVAGVGIGLGVVSAGMDLGKMAYENIPAVQNTVDSAVGAVKDVGSAIGEGLGKIGDGFASVFG